MAAALASLALSLLAFAPAHDSLLARRLWRAALEERAQLRMDRALVLLEAARHADPGFFPAHELYIEMRVARGEAGRLVRDYIAPRPAAPLARCLQIVSQHAVVGGVSSLGFADGVAADLQRLEAQFGPTACSAVYLARFAGSLPGSADTRRRIAQRATNYAPALPVVWETLGSMLLSGQHVAEAWRAFEQGAKSVDDPVGRIALLTSDAQARRTRGDTAGTRAVLAAAAASVAADPRPGVQVAFLVGVGQAALQRGPRGTMSAVERTALQRAAAIAAEHGAWELEWSIHFGRGSALYDQHGDAEHALLEFQRAASIADREGRNRLRLAAYTAVGRMEAKMGRRADAERTLTRALRIGSDFRNPLVLLEVRHNLAHLYESAGRTREALRAVDAFVRDARRQPANPVRIISLHDAGTIRWKAGLHAAANEAFAEMARVVDEQRHEFYWAGEYYERIGLLRRAIGYYERSRAAGENPSLTTAGLARCFQTLGMSDSALAIAQVHDTLVLDPADVPLLPEVLARRGRLREGAVAAQRWADAWLARGNVQAAATADLQAARLLLEAKDALGALEAARRSDSLARRINFPDARVAALRFMGQAHLALHERRRGIELLRVSLEMARRASSTGAVVETATALGDALANDADPRPALGAYAEAARWVEHTALDLTDDIARAGYRERNIAPFDGALRLAFRRRSSERLGKVYAWSERRKATAFRDLAPQSRGGPTSIATVRRRLGPGEALLDYIVVDTTIAVLAVTVRGASLITLSASRDSVGAWAMRLRAPMQRTVGGQVDLAHAPFDLRLGARLYGALLAPAANVLSQVTRVTIAPDGPVYYVPFQALPVAPLPANHASNGYIDVSYVIDRWLVRYALATGTPARRPLRRLSRTDALPALAVLSFRAPGGDREVELVRASWPSARLRVLRGSAATETAGYRLASGAELLHVSAHAVASAADPLTSHVLLAPDDTNDGLVHAREIATHPGKWRVVTLSGCETLAGKVYAGEGAMSLARAYLLAGAETVVATQWPIGAPMADVAGSFYAAMARGVDAPDALREAALTLRRRPATAHPFYWGGIVTVSAY